MVIGTKSYKACLKVTLTTPDGERFEEEIDIILSADSKKDVQERLRDLTASVSVEDVRITSVHHVGRKTKPGQSQGES
jgi:hypothetical protein